LINAYFIINLSSTSDTLVIGESAQLHVTISPNDASNKKFSWEVDDKVSINQSTGEVTALKLVGVPEIIPFCLSNTNPLGS
jgi:uncharacterized protein YjdB